MEFSVPGPMLGTWSALAHLNPTASTVDNEKMKPMEIKWLDQSHLLAKSSKLFSVNQTDYQALLRERVDRLGLGVGFRESRWHQRWKAVALPRCETLPVSYVATSSYPQWTPCWTLSRNDHAQELRMFFSYLYKLRSHFWKQYLRVRVFSTLVQSSNSTYDASKNTSLWHPICRELENLCSKLFKSCHF